MEGGCLAAAPRGMQERAQIPTGTKKKELMESWRPGHVSQWCELAFIVNWLIYIVKVTLFPDSGGSWGCGQSHGSFSSRAEEPLFPAPLCFQNISSSPVCEHLQWDLGEAHLRTASVTARILHGPL